MAVFARWQLSPWLGAPCFMALSVRLVRWRVRRGMELPLSSSGRQSYGRAWQIWNTFRFPNICQGARSVAALVASTLVRRQAFVFGKLPWSNAPAPGAGCIDVTEVQRQRLGGWGQGRLDSDLDRNHLGLCETQQVSLTSCFFWCNSAFWDSLFPCFSTAFLFINSSEFIDFILGVRLHFLGEADASDPSIGRRLRVWFVSEDVPRKRTYWHRFNRLQWRRLDDHRWTMDNRLHRRIAMFSIAYLWGFGRLRICHSVWSRGAQCQWCQVSFFTFREMELQQLQVHDDGEARVRTIQGGILQNFAALVSGDYPMGWSRLGKRLIDLLIPL